MPKSASGRTSKTKTSKTSTKKGSSVYSVKPYLSSILEVSAQEVVQEVIDELMERVLNKCYRVYIEQQTINFTLHCAQQAMLKVMEMYCYRHNDWQRDNNPHWMPDLPPPVSNPDSWAANQVPVFENVQDNALLNSMSRLGINMDNVEELGAQISDEPPPELVEDMGQIVQDIIQNVEAMIKDEPDKESVEHAKTLFTRLIDDHVEFKNFLIRTPTGIFKSHSIKLPKIELPSIEPIRSCEANLAKLPPIRTDATYKCRKQSPTTTPPPPPEKKKRDSTRR